MRASSTPLTRGAGGGAKARSTIARDRKTFSSIRKGPSDGENQINNLTLAFMDMWRRREPKRPGDSPDGESEERGSEDVQGTVPKGRRAPSAAAAHRVQVLRFLKATTQRDAQVLDLRGATLNTEDFVYVGVVLSNHPTISTVDLRGIPIPPLIARLLITLANQNKFLTDIFVDEDSVSTAHMVELLHALDSNRSYVTQERKRRWVEKEALLYRESVISFAHLMETFFVNEMRSRRDLEELEWERRTETVLKATSHRKRTLHRQHHRRTVEIVLERLQIVVEKEAEFRRAIRVERIRGVVRLAIDLESSARAALSREENRVRVELKQSETKDWVHARRREKVRKEFEASQRHDVEVNETFGRQGIVDEAVGHFRLIEDIASRDRDQVLIAESIRLEKERRDAIQKRKEADAARERKEREEKEKAIQLQRLRGEQRKERDRFDVEAGVGRKRIQSDRAAFFRGIEERWQSEWTVMRYYATLQSAYETFRGLMATPLSAVIRSNNAKLLGPLLERDALGNGDDPNAAPKRLIAPHISLRLEPLPGWTQNAVTCLSEVHAALAAFEERVAAALLSRGSSSAVGHRDSIVPSIASPDVVDDVGLGVSLRTTDLSISQPRVGVASSGGKALDDEQPHTSPTAERGALALSNASGPLNVSFLPPTPQEVRATSVHPLQLLVHDWSCDRLNALLSSVLSLPLLRLRTIDEIMLWKTNVTAVDIRLNVDVSWLAPAAVLELAFNPRVWTVSAVEGAMVACAVVSESESVATISIPTGVGAVQVQSSEHAPRILDALDERYYAFSSGKSQSIGGGLRRSTFRLSPPAAAATAPPQAPSDMCLESPSKEDAHVAVEPEESVLWDAPPTIADAGQTSIPMLASAASMAPLLEPSNRENAAVLGTLCVLEILRSASLRVVGKRPPKRLAQRRSSTAVSASASSTAAAVRLELALSCGDDTPRGALKLPNVIEEFP